MARKDIISDIPYLFVGAAVAVQEEIEKAADRLVEKGKSLTPEGRQKMMDAKKGLVSKGDEFSQVVARTVQRVLENSGIVTSNDLEQIDERVDEIEKTVLKKAKAGRAASKKKAKKPAAKKPARKKSASGKKSKKKSASKSKSTRSAKKPAAKKKPASKSSRKPSARPEKKPAVKAMIVEKPPVEEKKE